MIRLMEIPELSIVMELWRDHLINQVKVDVQMVEDYEPAAEEMMQHANVYVYIEKEEIKGFASVVGGYYISNLVIYENEAIEEMLIYLKERYDELQVDLPANTIALDVLLKNEFTLLGDAVHDVLKYKEKELEWLR